MSLFGSDIFTTSSGGGGSSTFIGLTDTFADYVGKANNIVAVKSDETGLEAIASGSSFPVETFTNTAKNLVVADNLKFFVMDNAAAQTVTIPENASEAFPIGAEMEFLRENATGTVTFVVSGSAVLQSRAGLVMINAQYSAATLKKVAADEWRLIGDLA